MIRAILTITILSHLYGVGTIPVANAQDSRTPAGEWRVTKLTGSIDFRTEGKPPPEGFCEPGKETYRAHRQDSFIELDYVDRPARATEYAAETAAQILNDFSDMMGLTIDDVPSVDASRQFLFHFEFDNGYHSNEVLGAAYDFDMKQHDGGLSNVRLVAVRRDAAKQAESLSMLPGGEALAAFSQAFGGIEGYVGTWLSESSDPAFVNTSVRIVGMEALQSGGGESGKSLFLVTGKFDDTHTMSGDWRFVETSRLLDCTSRASGGGSWAAAAR